MTWKFDPIIEDLVWTKTADLVEDGAIIDFGENSDLSIDTGDRTNEASEIDQGPRIFEV